MFEIKQEIHPWIEEKKPFALATVIHTWGSSPRPIGSAMAISEDMEMIGSVSGGCVEGAVVKKAMEVLASGKPKHISFGVADEDAWAVGLSCGGKIQVLLEPFVAYTNKAVWSALQDALENNKGCVLVSKVNDDSNAHLLVFPDGTTYGHTNKALAELALENYKARKNQLIELEGQSYFAQVFAPKSQLIIIGAAHITVDLVHFANQFGFETVVIDPRGIFANKTQFNSAPDQLIADWPAEVMDQFEFDPYTYAVILSHDPKIDDQALHHLLRSDVAYIGALGSKRTHAKRVARLEKAGYSEEEIARIHGPIGANINAKTPKEIALSIIAEIIQVKNAFR